MKKKMMTWKVRFTTDVKEKQAGKIVKGRLVGGLCYCKFFKGYDSSSVMNRARKLCKKDQYVSEVGPILPLEWHIKNNPNFSHMKGVRS